MKTCPMKTRIFHANVLKMCVGWGFFEIRRWVFTQLFPRMHFQSVPGCNQGSRMRRFPITRVDWKLRLVDFFSTAIFFLYPLEGKVHFDASKYTGLFYGYLRWFPEKKWLSFLLFSNSLWMDLFWLVATQICFVFTPILGVSWSNLTNAQNFSNGWVKNHATRSCFGLLFKKSSRIFAWGFGMPFERRELLLFGIAQAQRMCVSSLFFGQTICWEPSREERGEQDFAPFFFSEKWKSSVVPGCQNCLKM